MLFRRRTTKKSLRWRLIQMNVIVVVVVVWWFYLLRLRDFPEPGTQTPAAEAGRHAELRLFNHQMVHVVHACPVPRLIVRAGGWRAREMR